MVTTKRKGNQVIWDYQTPKPKSVAARLFDTTARVTESKKFLGMLGLLVSSYVGFQGVVRPAIENILSNNTNSHNNEYLMPVEEKENETKEKAIQLFSTSSEDFVPNANNNSRLQEIMKSDSLIQSIEKKYQIQEGLLAGWAAREYGQKFPLNLSKDGGAGAHIHFQPGTAQHYGMKTYGTSKTTGADHIHGKQLDSLAKALNYDMSELEKYDERFNEQKNLEGAAQYLVEEYKKHNSWNKALRAVNAGTPGKNYLTTRHNILSREYQRQILLERQKQGIVVDEELLSDIHDITAYFFKDEGNNQYSHISLTGDNIENIANRFEKVTGKKIDSTNMYRSNGKIISNGNLKPEEKLYITLN